MAELPENRSGAQQLRRAHILLVDDNPANLLALRVLLEPLDQILVEACSGEDALERVKSDDFAVVLLDVLMPGIGGFETASLIRSQKRSSHTPIIFLTASDIERPQLEVGYALGAVDFLVKPLIPVILQSKVRGFVELFQDKQQAKDEAEQLRLLVHGTTEYAIFMLDPQGRIASWNAGAERLKGYKVNEIIGQHFSQFYPQEALDRGWPDHELKVATAEGRFEDEGWRVRKDGSQFWANVVITALKDEHGELRGFSKITRDMTERKKSEENARHLVEQTTARRVAEENSRLIEEQRERLRVTLASIGDAVISTDGAGRVDFLNPVAERLVGWNSEEAANQSLPDVFRIVNEGSRQPVENPALRALKEGVVVGLANHTILIARDGKERPIDDSAAPIRDTNGNVIGSVLVFRDISEKKRAQQVLRESEGRFRGLMEQAPFSVQVFTPDGRTVGVNRAWEELWGVTLDQLADYNVLEDPQLEAKGISRYLRRAFDGEPVEIPAIEYDPGQTIPNRSRHKDPKRWVSAVAYPLKDESGIIREVVLVHQDITARRRAEEERDRFTFLVQNSHDFIGMCDMDFRPFFVNREGIRLVGFDSLEQALSTPVLDFFFPEDQAFLTEQFFPHVIRDGFGEVEIRFRHFKSGEPIWFTYSVLALRDGDGKPNGFATISRDITRLKQANEALQQADRRKDEFLATLAHELRNPLAPIRNSLQVLKMPRVDAEMAAQTREMMERQVHHLVRLVDDLLDVSRVMRGKIELRRERVELATIIARAVETAKPLIEVQGHQLEIRVANESLLVDADPVRLTQVFGNLLTNAAKYTEPHGQVWLSADRDGEQALLTIRDTGIGIAPDMLPHVFELFVQADQATTKAHGGLGIGLTLAKNLVEMHGGRIEAHSGGLGKGSEFTIYLPLLALQASALEAKTGNSSDHVIRNTGHRLLVVDDNHDAAITLSMLLRLQGHEVRVAHNGLSALEVAASFRPDLIFLDLGMPGMDGYEVARRIRQSPGLEATILAALTGWGQPDDRRRTAEAGFDHHLVKPVEPKAIESLLAALPIEK
jgi:PAS domain S-box-containing protein